MFSRLGLICLDHVARLLAAGTEFVSIQTTVYGWSLTTLLMLNRQSPALFIVQICVAFFP